MNKKLIPLFFGLLLALPAQSIPNIPNIFGNNFYQVGGLVAWGEGGTNSHSLAYKKFPIPTGKIFVIEFVTVTCTVASREVCQATLIGAINGREATEHYLDMQLIRTDGDFRTYRVSQTVKIYAGKEHELFISRPVDAGSAGGGITYSLAGYLIDGN